MKDFFGSLFCYSESMAVIDDNNYTSIIPTAYITAYPRLFTDIPYSKPIFEALEKIRHSNDETPLGENYKVVRLAPELEARYKLIDKLLDESSIQQVLELASGLSPRGLILTEKDFDTQYAELELKEMAQLKQSILGAISIPPNNLHITPGNALRAEDFNAAIKSFDISKRMAVLNEGLLRYLNFDEKTLVAKNVHSVLSRFGGIWITCDTTPKSFLNTQDTLTKPGMNRDLSSISQKDFTKNMFEDEPHVERFFSDLGFSVEFHPLTEIESELVSPGILKIPSEEVEQLLGSGVVVVMRVKHR